MLYNYYAPEKYQYQRNHWKHYIGVCTVYDCLNSIQYDCLNSAKLFFTHVRPHWKQSVNLIYECINRICFNMIRLYVLLALKYNQDNANTSWNPGTWHHDAAIQPTMLVQCILYHLNDFNSILYNQWNYIWKCLFSCFMLKQYIIFSLKSEQPHIAFFSDSPFYPQQQKVSHMCRSSKQ